MAHTVLIPLPGPEVERLLHKTFHFPLATISTPARWQQNKAAQVLLPVSFCPAAAPMQLSFCFHGMFSLELSRHTV
jgi:hypothetical protein